VNEQVWKDTLKETDRDDAKIYETAGRTSTRISQGLEAIITRCKYAQLHNALTRLLLPQNHKRFLITD
jgi:hypothetical protein